MHNFSQTTSIPLSQIELNIGQLPGLPSNPRQILEDKFQKLKENIRAYPELLGWRALLVYPLGNGKYIIIGGNMRYRALMSMGYSEAPCIVLPSALDVERLKAYTIIDNNPYGQWDWDLLANEWDEEQLLDWGMSLDFELEKPKKGQVDHVPEYSVKLEFETLEELQRFRQGYEEQIKGSFKVKFTVKDE